MLVPELKDLAEKLGLKGYKKLNKQELIYKILDQQALALESNKENGKKETAASNSGQEENKPSRQSPPNKRRRTTRKENSGFLKPSDSENTQSSDSEENDKRHPRVKKEDEDRNRRGNDEPDDPPRFQKEEMDVCPLNFKSKKLTELELDDFINLNTLNTHLVLINLKYTGSKSTERYPLDVQALLDAE